MLTLYSTDNTKLMEVEKLERVGNELLIKGKVFGAMPMTAISSAMGMAPLSRPNLRGSSIRSAASAMASRTLHGSLWDMPHHWHVATRAGGYSGYVRRGTPFPLIFAAQHYMGSQSGPGTCLFS